MRETVDWIHSDFLGNRRQVWLRAPLDSTTAQHVVVFLDAEMYREHIKALATVERLENENRIADAWYVFVSSESPEARWKECPCYPPFAAFMVDELLPWLERRAPAIVAAKNRSIVGFSYTGLAAAYIARQRAGVFRRVISQSGSFWWNDGQLIEQYAHEPTPVPTHFYLEVGTRETQRNLQHRPDVFQSVSQLEAVRRFRDVLVERGHDVTYAESDGAHDTAAWQRMLPRALEWAAPATGRERETGA